MAKRISLNVSLTPKNQSFITARIKSGRYQSASEVVRDALHALATREARERAEAQSWKEKIAEGIAQADRGDLLDGERVFELIEKLDTAEAELTRPRRSRKSA